MTNDYPNKQMLPTNEQLNEFVDDIRDFSPHSSSDVHCCQCLMFIQALGGNVFFNPSSIHRHQVAPMVTSESPMVDSPIDSVRRRRSITSDNDDFQTVSVKNFHYCIAIVIHPMLLKRPIIILK